MSVLLYLALLATPLFVFVFTLKYRIRNARSPLNRLPGPPSRSWLYGNVKEIFEKGQTVAWDEWMSVYGKTFQYPTTFNVRFLSYCSQPGLIRVLPRLLRFLPPILER